MTVKAVLFDCDGVLINTEEIGYRLLSKIFAQHAIHYSRETFVEMLSGITYKAFQKKVLTQHPELPDGFFDDFSAKMQVAHDAEMRAIDGVKELLQNLKDAGIPFAVCSNSGAEGLRHKLRKTGLYDYFVPHIYSRDDVDHGKPAPDMYLLAARIFDVDPKDCFVVEDSMTGTMAGVRADMGVIGFVGEAHRDDSEAGFLKRAGAKMIAFDMGQVWAHISRARGMSPASKSPEPGPR
ncbi:MAG: HAD family phosphatase [Rhodospirillales bacterium]|nr:HAD family phosphatase [Rhodospirillales bacterium]MCB9996346.1 HAD family phosphatase [Rhodospirillales bacterium]